MSYKFWDICSFLCKLLIGAGIFIILFSLGSLLWGLFTFSIILFGYIEFLPIVNVFIILLGGFMILAGWVGWLKIDHYKYKVR